MSQNTAQCPFHAQGEGLKPGLSENMPPGIAALPRLRGFPVPWFVDKVNGEYDFRIMDPDKFRAAVRCGLCWICGRALGARKTFVLGPMCAINRTISEPPSHLECARYSARHCPFLSIPHMKRREDEVTESMERHCAGVGLKRNPGAVCLWTIRRYTIFKDPRGLPLFTFPDPESVEWYAEGRTATRDEVMQSIESGLPYLRAACEQEEPSQREAAHRELDAFIKRAEPYLPPS